MPSARSHATLYEEGHAGRYIMRPGGKWSKDYLVIDLESLKESPNRELVPVLRVERAALSGGASQLPARASATEDQPERNIQEIGGDDQPLGSGGNRQPTNVAQRMSRAPTLRSPKPALPAPTRAPPPFLLTSRDSGLTSEPQTQQVCDQVTMLRTVTPPE